MSNNLLSSSESCMVYSHPLKLKWSVNLIPERNFKVIQILTKMFLTQNLHFLKL